MPSPFAELWHRAEAAGTDLAYAEGKQDADPTRLDLLLTRRAREGEYERAVDTLDLLWNALSITLPAIRYNGFESAIVLLPMREFLTDIEEAAWSS